MKKFHQIKFNAFFIGLCNTLITLCFFFCVSVSATPQHAQNEMASGRQTISLSGLWKFKSGELDESPTDPLANDIARWTDIHVPANWYLEGHDISGVAWYAKNFTLPAELRNKHVSVRFSGVDYTAEIWLNGKYIGFHEGYFQPFSFDITKAVNFGKENRLMVKVNSPLEKMVEDWSLHKRNIKGIFGHHDTRPGGAWSARGQEKNTGGIWAAVDLEIHEATAIEDIKVTSKLKLSDNSATADVQLQLGLQESARKAVTIRFTLKPLNFLSTQSVTKEIKQELSPGFNSISLGIPVQDPKLWWPWDQGQPNLYQLEVQVLAGNQLLDTKVSTFGFREVRYDKAKNEWRINGKRMFLRGTNYIASQWLSEMTPERFAQDIALMKAANINIVRVHAHVTADSYYRLCDQAGLLNWQDFPLQWGYLDSEEFTRNAVRQARDMVNSLYNHPSIVVWSLINEPAWEATWMVTKYKHYNKSQNKSLTETLYKAIYPLDRSRYVHPYSSSAEHPWLGWYSGHWLDYKKPTKISLVAEYGAQALPDLKDLRKIIDGKNLWPVTDEQWDQWEYHNFRRKETFKYAKILKGNMPAEFVRNTQLYQAKLIKLAAESYRRQRYKPVSGIFQFMFVEDWPSMNWGVVDYWRVPKLGYYALKEAYQPVLPSIDWKQENYKRGDEVSFNLWAINDLHTSYPKAQVRYTLTNGKTAITTESLTVDIAADSGKCIKTVKWNNLPPGQYKLVFTIADNKGNRLGINTNELTVKP